MRRNTLTTLLLLTPLSVLAAATTSPSVKSGTIDYGSNQVMLTGSGFEPAKDAPAVKFDGNSLKIESFSDSQIVAKLPANTKAGTFDLKVTNSEGKDSGFVLTYGATGPQGPAGPTGPPGGVMSYVAVIQPGQGPVVLPYESWGTVYSITLPNAGTYVINGQQMISNRNTNGAVNATCALVDSGGIRRVLLVPSKLCLPGCPLPFPSADITLLRRPRPCSM